MADEHGLLARWKLALACSRDRALSAGDNAVLMSVLDCINDTAGVAWPGLKKISDDANVDRSTAVRSVARLVERGYLKRESGDRTRSNRYSMGRCDIAPRCESTPRCEPAPKVGANLRLQVGANPHPDSAYKNIPIEPAQKLTPARESKKTDSPVGRFAEFYGIYPRKEALQAAEKAWKRHKLDRHADQILADVTARVADPGQWIERRFIPLPATYLNQQRWLDEWSRPGVASSKGVLPRDTRTEADMTAANEAQMKRMEAMA